jgi:hypothetical protein
VPWPFPNTDLKLIRPRLPVSTAARMRRGIRSKRFRTTKASGTGPGPAAIPFAESTHRRLEQLNTMVAGFGHFHECRRPIPTRPVTDRDRRFTATVTRPSHITIVNHVPLQHASATHAADPLTVMIKDSSTDHQAALPLGTRFGFRTHLTGKPCRPQERPGQPACRRHNVDPLGTCDRNARGAGSE